MRLELADPAERHSTSAPVIPLIEYDAYNAGSYKGERTDPHSGLKSGREIGEYHCNNVDGITAALMTTFGDSITKIRSVRAKMVWAVAINVCDAKVVSIDSARNIKTAQTIGMAVPQAIRRLLLSGVVRGNIV